MLTPYLSTSVLNILTLIQSNAIKRHFLATSTLDSSVFIRVTESWLLPEISQIDMGFPGYTFLLADRDSALVFGYGVNSHNAALNESFIQFCGH